MFLSEQFEFLLQEAGPFEERAMVMGVYDKSFDIFILKFGVSKRVYTDVSFYSNMHLSCYMVSHLHTYVYANEFDTQPLTWFRNQFMENISFCIFLRYKQLHMYMFVLKIIQKYSVKA